MTTDKVYDRISRYWDNTSTRPILVDVPDSLAKTALRKHFAVNGINVISCSEFCPQDEMPQWDKVKHFIRTSEGRNILIDLCDFLKLEGATKLKTELRQLLDIIGAGKVVIVTVGCSKWLKFSDPRLESSGKMSIIEGEPEATKSLLFVTPGLMEPSLCIEGINSLPRQSAIQGDEAIVITDHKATNFPDSLYDIKEYSSKYEVLLSMYPELGSLPSDFGTDNEWDSLYETIEKWGSLEDSLIGFGGKNGLAQAFFRFEEFDAYDKWFFLLCLKIFGASGNKYLTAAARRSNTVNELATHIYEDILDVAPNHKNFNDIYKERRSLLPHLSQYPDATDKFCKVVWSKGNKALAYLSDASKKEKENIIAFLDKYGEGIGRKNTMNQLKVVYPALYKYLSDYSYGNPLLDKYFREYKYSKAINHISDEMRDMVEEQAVKRDYNTLLKPRSLVVDGLNAKDTVLYFMDALGAEYLSYLRDCFYENGFDFSAQIARCDLPSITSVNKDFVNVFKDYGCRVVSKKELDELKHEGGDSYDYESSKLPIHLIAELEIIDKLVNHLKGSLEKGKRVFIIADHGTSRLAVINEQENKWEVTEKGLHSGRCCPISDIDEKPESATESNDFWCLANYDRFKGGRKALVEVHGGATLEEVTIPVIEVSKRDKTISCEVRNDGPALRGVKVIPILKLFVEKDSPNIEVELDGIRYQSKGCTVQFIHEFELAGVKRAGTYKFNVYCENILIARNLEIEVANKGAQERSFF